MRAALRVSLCVAASLVSCSDPGPERPSSEPLPEVYPGAAAITFVRTPYLQNPGDDRMVVMWQTAEPCQGLVEVRSPTWIWHTEPTAEATRFEVALEDLPPHAVDLTYRVYCLVGDASTLLTAPVAAATGERLPFRLAPARGTPFRLAVFGDSQSHPEVFSRIAGAILADDPGLVVGVGDLVGDGRDATSFDTELFVPAAALMARVPLLSALGNHEHNARSFYDLLSQPGDEDHFALPWGDAFLVVLNSNDLQLLPEGPMLVWLEETLGSAEAQAAPWRILFAHHPPYCEGWGHEGFDGDALMRSTALPVIEAAGVDLVLNGHAHDYERGTLNGVTWIITGGGGGSLDAKQQDWEHLTVYAAVHHYTRVDVDVDRIHVVATSLDGTVIDDLTLER